MNKKKIFLLGAISLLTVAVVHGCARRGSAPGESREEPVVLEEGSTADQPGYYIDEDGRVVYRESRTSPEGGGEAGESVIDAIPLFPGVQRIYPSGEDSNLRRSYLTRAPIDAIDQFYNNYLAYGEAEPDADMTEPESFVNSITSTEDGRRQTTLFVNESDGPRGGMKVMLKEFPAQHAVQIILTTLDATPTGLNPIGFYITPEQAQQWAEQSAARQEEAEDGDAGTDDSEEGE